MNRIAHTEWSRMDRPALQSAYDSANRSLKDALLNGTPWEEVQEIRFQVTAISMALHRCRRPATGSPDARFSRGAEGRSA